MPTDTSSARALGGTTAAQLPDTDLARFTLRRASAMGDKPAVVDGDSGRALSYAELERAVRSLAAGLAATGFGRGDTCCVCLPNVPEFAVAFNGVIAAGGRCTTANPSSTSRELGRQLADTGARVLLTVPPALQAARAAATASGCAVYVLGGAEGAAGFDALLGEPAAAPTLAVDPAFDTAAILYSGGTTGLPKGVLLSHRNLIATLVHAEAAPAVTAEDVVIAALPFFHVYGLHVILNLALQAGATVVAMPRFEFTAFLDLLERHRVTRAFVVPPMALALATDPAVDDRDLSALRHVLSGAAPLGTALTEALERRLGCRVSEGYGMTEMSGVTHAVPPFGAARKPGSVGPPIPGVECRLVDPETGEDAGRGQPGELCLRGPKVMQGYLNKAEATGSMIDPDGWLHTGDIAIVDEDGWYRVVDRIKDIIRYKGYQVSPAELEMVLLDHPDVADCAVVGIADERAGEVPKAFVVPVGKLADPEPVLRFVAERVAPYKRIRAVEIVDSIPKSPSGRILRRYLRERERAATAGG